MQSDFGSTIARDYLVIDGRQTVTFTRVSQEGDEARTVTGVHQFKIPQEEVLASDGFYSAADVAWNLPTEVTAWSDADPIEPREGDTVEGEDGVVWTVQEVWLLTLISRWRLVCKRQRSES
jgi:hypothetical protein